MARRSFSREVLLPMPVWDAATRLFHWALLLAVAAAFATAWSRPAWSGAAALHRPIGYAVLALLLFRLAWGLIGSDTARFSRFLRGPGAVVRQLGRFAVREPDRAVGHTPACGWMSVILLVSLAVQVGTGLAGSPAHRLVAWIVLGLIALHILAILAYALLKRQDLVRPMVIGRKRLPAATPAPRMVNQGLALIILVVAGAVAWGVAVFL